MPYITQILGTGKGGYFADAAGVPRLLVFDYCQAIIWKAGMWNGAGGGTWQQDMVSYFAARSSQGYNALYTLIVSDHMVSSDALPYGQTWDGVYPFTINGVAGPISSGTLALNDPYWQRVDYLCQTALAYDMTVFLNFGFSYDFGGTNAYANITSTQETALGAAVATRYPISTYPNVQWFFGDDDNVGTNDADFGNMLTGIRSTGDTRSMISMENEPQVNCHVQFDDQSAWNASGFSYLNATYNWCYDYHETYIGIEESYKETGTLPQIPPIQGDGKWYGDYDSNPDFTERRHVWWALASGARGIDVTNGPSAGASVWQWWTDAVAQLTSNSVGPLCTSTIGVITAYFTSLAGWHKLIPDTATCSSPPGGAPGQPRSARRTTIRTGTGTPTPSGGQRHPGRRSGCHLLRGAFFHHHRPEQADPGYGAKWVDPNNCAITAATAGATYNSTPLGSNARVTRTGWLVLAQPPYATWKVP